jgi:hypothetical protein
LEKLIKEGDEGDIDFNTFPPTIEKQLEGELIFEGDEYLARFVILIFNM